MDPPALDSLLADGDFSAASLNAAPTLRMPPSKAPSKLERNVALARRVRLSGKVKGALLGVAWVLLTLLGLLVPQLNLYMGMFLFLVGLLSMGIGFIGVFIKLIGQDPGEFFKYALLSQVIGGYAASKTLDPEKAHKRGNTSAGIAGTFFIIGAILFFAGFVNVLLAALNQKAEFEAKMAWREPVFVRFSDSNALVKNAETAFPGYRDFASPEARLQSRPPGQPVAWVQAPTLRDYCSML